MKKTLISISFAVILSACSYKTIPLKGNYSKAPYELTTPNDFETVWGKLIDLFAQKGLGIKLIDKSSGLLVAHNALVPVTREDKNGKLVDPNAWVVSAQIYEPGSRKYYYPTTAAVEWNVRVKDLKGQGTVINVNITSISSATGVLQVNPVFGVSNTELVNTGAVSTGVFEKLMADTIK